MSLRLPLPIATRESPLALAQAHLVQSLLIETFSGGEDDFPIVGLTTTGDRLTDRKLIDAGGKGLFTKEIDDALFEGRAAIAVHSMKDVPTQMPDGLELASILEREDPRDVLLVDGGSAQLSDLPDGTLLGTASLRRQAQALYHRPDLKIETLRGNVDTRLGKLAAGSIQATFLARAGLKRLGRAQGELEPIPVDMMLPAAGQAAIGLAIRAGDDGAREAARALNHAPSETALLAERAFLAALDGSCRTPIAAHATLDGDQIHLTGEALMPDGSQRWRDDMSGPAANAAELGNRLGEAIRAAGGEMLREAVAAS